MTQYLPFYAPGAGKAVFEDGMMFMVTVPLRGEEIGGDASAPQVTPQVAMVLEAAETACSATELLASAGLRDRAHFRKAYLEPLLQAGWIERTIPKNRPVACRNTVSLQPDGKALEDSTDS